MTYWILTPLALLAAFGWGMQVGERRADAVWAPAVLRLLDRRLDSYANPVTDGAA